MSTRFDRIRDALGKLDWSEGAIQQVLNEGPYCAYCGKPMLESVDDFRLWENDHILPKNKYPELAKDDEQGQRNLVGVCRVCNLLKRTWVPNDVEGKPKIYSKGAGLTDEMRREFLLRSRAHIRKLRTKKLAELHDTRRAFDDYWEESKERTSGQSTV